MTIKHLPFNSLVYMSSFWVANGHQQGSKSNPHIFWEREWVTQLGSAVQSRSRQLRLGGRQGQGVWWFIWLSETSVSSLVKWGSQQDLPVSLSGGVKRDCSKHNTCKSSLFCQVQVFATPWTVAHQAPLSMEFSRQESWTGLGNHSLLQGIFPIQGSNPGLLHCRWILYCLSRQRSPGWYLVCSQHTINVSRGNAVSLVNDDAPALSQSP